MQPAPDATPTEPAPADETTPAAEEAAPAPAEEEGAELADAAEAAPADAEATTDDAPPAEAEPAGELVSDPPAPSPDATPSLPGVVGLGLGLVLAAALSASLVRGWLGRGRATPELEDRSGIPEASAAPLAPPEPAEPPLGLAERLVERMSQTRRALQQTFDGLFGRDRVDEELLEDLEDALLIADVGVPTTTALLDGLRERLDRGEDDPAVFREALRTGVRDLLEAVHAPFQVDATRDPFVLLVVGVNGSGKTTTIGKLAAKLGREGHRVLLAAGDTYRAAASEQLEVWAERAGADIVRHEEGADPGAVVFDALDAARARGADVVIVDTAGRLQTARPLMEQLSKVRRVIQKKVPDGPHATLLVVDGTMGQNAMSQARSFHEATPLTGVVVTKLDGTAKGGMVLAIAAEMKLPVTFIGIGEQVDDLRPFEVDAFVDALV